MFQQPRLNNYRACVSLSTWSLTEFLNQWYQGTGENRWVVSILGGLFHGITFASSLSFSLGVLEG
ncbi:hypothetical protein BDV29DRAFT_181937 [Aspergillus leporis]|uniref:Uncharacterized protein n=1 Tax=Aspergillus leporis TaxID=41062 RepID=A0A5N5WN47_9EURO|nr:hypothetical protein BDV29DRAFT_181937 [Aspergillus leporis]